MSEGEAAKSPQVTMPSAERIAEELGRVKSLDDFFGRDGVFARLFAKTLEGMLATELTQHLGYERYAAEGRNSGNSRNGHYSKKVRTSAGEQKIEVPRDRQGEFSPQILQRYAHNTNELEEKIIGMYAKGMSLRDIEEMLGELYGVDVSAATISAITDKVWGLVESWQNRPLAPLYAIIYMDAIYLKIRQKSRVENVAVHVVLGVDLDGQRDVLGHWVGDGAEAANYWLKVLSDLQNRGVQDILIACVDGLEGFEEAIHAIFPQAQVQRCIIHQIRNSLRYVSWKDRKAFVADLKTIYQAPTREEAETQLAAVAQTWKARYAIAVRSWEQNWESLSTFFDYPQEIRRLIYTTNAVEGYHRQLRKVTKTKGAFPTPEAARKLLYLVHMDITKNWNAPMRDWPLILNQLAILFQGRFPA
jgi:transposase-like protein